MQAVTAWWISDTLPIACSVQSFPTLLAPEKLPLSAKSFVAGMD